MKKICTALCLILLGIASVSAHDSGTLKVEVLTKTSLSWDGSALPKYPKGKPEITILRITVPPKTKLALHQHPVINAGVLLQGQLTVVKKDEKILHLKAGDAIVEVVDTWHYGKNEGDEPAVIIVFYAGTVGSEITVKKKDK